MNTTETLQTLSWEAAHTAVRAAVERAGSLGIRINAAVVDAAGLPAAFLRMTGAPLHSSSIAQDKAYTAAGFSLSTAEWDAVVGDNEALRTGLAQRPRLVMFGGGLPVLGDGTCLGGIGVSGGSEEQDEECARAGLAAIGLA
ncbi:GlcG/HbpS family heme-binding protein [Arhodomonas sp. SL1]|uniref:GlcG/HbpS family heme-binding protein n=1 Tax=Arhodomonas sp. SL1 TaxID=3425691 RepID=UPI003F884430